MKRIYYCCLLPSITIKERSDEQGDDEKPGKKHDDRSKYRVHYTLLVLRYNIPSGVIHTGMTPVTVRREDILYIIFLLIIFVDESDDRGNKEHGRDETGGNAKCEQGAEALVTGKLSEHEGTEASHGRE